MAKGHGRERRLFTVRRLKLASMVFVLAWGAAAAVTAADRPAHWLMREPVTLFDLGIFKLRQDLATAATRMVESGALLTTPVTGVFYDWQRQKIIVYLTLTAGAVQPSAALCRETYQATQETLLQGGPSGPRRAESYLEEVFLHEGPGNAGRPSQLATDMLETVQLEVTVLPRDLLGNAPLTVKCVGRLDAEADEIKTSVRG
jgi:hypothetical protein